MASRRGADHTGADRGGGGAERKVFQGDICSKSANDLRNPQSTIRATMYAHTLYFKGTDKYNFEVNRKQRTELKRQLL